MGKIVLLAFVISCLVACKEKGEESVDNVLAEAEIPSESGVFGLDFENENILTAAQMGDIYRNLEPGDTINVTFKGMVEEVCQAKGCWMKVDVGAIEPVMVKFKDYGFFVPKDLSSKEVTVHGKAFIAEVPVDEQRHLAVDAGMAEEEVATIDTPKRTLSFTADGVKIN